MLEGGDFRALVVDNKLVAIAERTPAHVVGNGKNTVQELIDVINSDPRRGYGHENVLTQIDVDEQSEKILKAKNFTIETVLPENEILYLKTTANISTGGTAIDRTDEAHPENIFLFERIAKIVGLDVTGVDVIAPNISEPLRENGGGIIEVNAAPGFRMHLAPSEGIGRNVAEHVVNMLFPPGKPSRIPIFAITGTNGKTTTTRFIAHILRGSGLTVGFTTTDGTYIQNNQIVTGDNTGPVSAQLVLKDPSVQVAVLETARGGIIRSGLGYEHCDVAVVTNVAADHLGIKDINTLEDLARVKAVVPRSVSSKGFAVLNAEDENVYPMRKLVNGTVVLFAMDENHPNIQRHARRGGISCVYENGFITLLRGKWKVRVEKAINVPLTYGARAEFMIQNVLAATLACFVHGVSLEDICGAGDGTRRNYSFGFRLRALRRGGGHECRRRPSRHQRYKYPRRPRARQSRRAAFGFKQRFCGTQCGRRKCVSNEKVSQWNRRLVCDGRKSSEHPATRPSRRHFLRLRKRFHHFAQGQMESARRKSHQCAADLRSARRVYDSKCFSSDAGVFCSRSFARRHPRRFDDLYAFNRADARTNEFC
jgi:cyanophycin synthetase